MLSSEFVEQCKELVGFWKEEAAPDSVLEDLIMAYLPDADEQGYELHDLLSTDVIDMLLKKADLQLKYMAHGGVSMISNGRVIDRSHLAPRYRLLIDRWVRRGWVRINPDGSIARIQ